jgi:hypothetical protein
MKREIICVGCEPRVRAAVSRPFPGEHDKWISGKARADFVCDHCAEPIAHGADCWALSIWADYGSGGIGYRPWEQEYID